MGSQNSISTETVALKEGDGLPRYYNGFPRLPVGDSVDWVKEARGQLSQLWSDVREIS